MLNILETYKCKNCVSCRSADLHALCNLVLNFVSTGGLTTLVDMPLNSFPSTVSEKTFELKVCRLTQKGIAFFKLLKPTSEKNHNCYAHFVLFFPSKNHKTGC